jgi:hypothetical protein
MVGDKDYVQAWRMLRRLCEVGLLEHTKVGSFADRLANEYRYLGNV